MRSPKPSKTAREVALNILALGSKPEMAEVLPPGIVDATAKLLVASGTASSRLVRWARAPRMPAVYEAFDWMMPGQFEAFAHRKAFCEEQVRAAISGGATQVLVLGAGYDTLCWRLAPEFPDVRFGEIDCPATATLKSKAITAMGSRPNLAVIGADLGKRRLVDVLASEDGWDCRGRSVIPPGSGRSPACRRTRPQRTRLPHRNRPGTCSSRTCPPVTWSTTWRAI